jgi:ankyrin repeat protein
VTTEALHEYERILAMLRTGTPTDLDLLARNVEHFPTGVDGFIGRRWIINAIDIGSRESVEWMLDRGVDLNFRDDEGRTPIHAVLERETTDRYSLLNRLLDAGAAINLKGVNDWTPAHMAAAHDDVEGLRILVRRGADLTIRTAIDDYATPLEEARNLGKTKAVSFLESVV